MKTSEKTFLVQNTDCWEAMYEMLKEELLVVQTEQGCPHVPIVKKASSISKAHLKHCHIGKSM